MLLEVKVEPKDDSNDPLIKERKLLPIIVYLVGGFNKHDLMKNNQILSIGYKLCILLFINVMYWKTMQANFLKTSTLDKGNAHGFEIGIVAFVVYFTLNYLYSTISMIIYIYGFKREEALQCQTTMMKTMAELNGIRKRLGVHRSAQSEKRVSVLVILEILTFLVMCSVQHYIAVYINYFNFPTGFLLVNMYCYVLRSIVDYVFIMKIMDLGVMFSYIEYYIQVVTQEEISNKNSYGKALKPLNHNESSLLKREYTKSLFQIYRFVQIFFQ